MRAVEWPLRALERRRCARPADCPDPLIGAIVAEGEPEPAAVAPCPRCGGRHILVIVERVVDPAATS
jgi:hypothetical protein